MTQTLCCSPKYINITRGQIICALIGGWCMVPWKILASAIAFLNFMSACKFIPLALLAPTAERCDSYEPRTQLMADPPFVIVPFTQTPSLWHPWRES